GNVLVPLPLHLEVEEDPFADRIFAREECLRHRLADDDLAWARMLRVEADAIVAVERATVLEWNARRLEVLRIDAALERGEEGPRHERPSFDVEEEDVAGAGQRRARRQPDRGDAGQHAQPIAELREEGRSLRGLRIAREGQQRTRRQ